MRKILASLLLLLSSAVMADPQPRYFAAYPSGTTCNSSNIATCGATFEIVDNQNLPIWYEQYNIKTGLCEAVANTGYAVFNRDGSNADSVSPNTTYIYSDGNFCKYGTTHSTQTISNGSSWQSPSGTVQGAFLVSGYPDNAACSALNGTMNGFQQCFCASGETITQNGCGPDNQCDTGAIPNTSSFAVDIFTSTAPSSVCVDNCLASMRTSGVVSIPRGSFTTHFYQTDASSCSGGEFNPDPADFTQGNPLDPICETHGGNEYCYDPVTNTVSKNGFPAWDFDNGDYFDGYCAIRSGGTFTCGPNSTLPGTDASDPEVPYAADTDDDGVPDFYFVADSASGLNRIAPGTSIDTTGDGQADSVAIDTNNDGISDSVKRDFNGDKLPDQDDPSTPGIDESAPPGDTNIGGSGGGNNTDDNNTGSCVDNPNTPWNECDTDGDGEGGDPGDGSCQDDPSTPWNDCSVGADLDGCNKEPEVTGDPLQAAAIFLAWQSACSGYVSPDQRNNGLDLTDTRPEDDGSFLSTAVDLPTSLDQSGFLGSGSGLPDYSLSILGQSYDIEVSKWEPFLQTAGALLVIMSLLWAGRLLVEA